MSPHDRDALSEIACLDVCARRCHRPVMLPTCKLEEPLAVAPLNPVLVAELVCPADSPPVLVMLEPVDPVDVGTMPPVLAPVITGPGPVIDAAVVALESEG